MSNTRTLRADDYYYTADGKHILRVKYGEDHDGPRSWDNLGTFVTFESRCDSPDHNRFSCWSDLFEYFGAERTDDVDTNIENLMEGAEKKGYILLPVWKLDHSRVVYSTESFYGRTESWHARFDSGVCGVIYVEKDDVRKEYNCKRVSKKTRALVESVLEAEVDIYSQWANGDVYGIVEYDMDGDAVDSMTGFYDMDTAESYFEFGEYIGDYNSIEDCLEDIIPEEDEELEMEELEIA